MTEKTSMKTSYKQEGQLKLCTILIQKLMDRFIERYIFYQISIKNILRSKANHLIMCAKDVCI